MQRFSLILRTLASNNYNWLRSVYAKHLLLALLITVILLFITGRLLVWFTHHGQVVLVPDLTGLTMEEVTHKQYIEDFKLVVVDSVYDPEKKKGSIAFQDPLPDTKVKRNRAIYLTLVAILHEQVKMPSLTDMTLRQATAVLETYGLRTGTIDFIPDLAKNAVLKQRYKGNFIEAGTWIEKGARVDLVVGQGSGSGEVHLPFLLGLKRAQAIDAIQNAFFVPGKEIFEDGKDTAFSRVYRQSPSYASKNIHKPGETIDLWYRSEKKFDFDTYLKQYTLDSLRESTDEDDL